MPLFLDPDRVPAVWAEALRFRSRTALGAAPPAECLKIVLVNNMPDTALEDTEWQFLDLLDSAAGDLAIEARLCCLPGVPRGSRAQRHLGRCYSGLEELWNASCDGLIITGAEPRSLDLRTEPYWPALADVLAWAERNTASAVLSCLAAHAGVLRSDGIERHPLASKRVGVFACAKVADHSLTRRLPSAIRFPHSRWNELRMEDLTACGYTVLTQSAAAGVDMFVKQKGKSLFVHFQGHPEYGARTLLKEYRRDIRRFLRGEKNVYPPMPQGYFDAVAAQALGDFQVVALSHPQQSLLADFPESLVAATLRNTWRRSAVSLYRAWLQGLVAHRAGAAAAAVMARLV